MVYWIHKQNTGVGTKRLQGQQATVLAQNPNSSPRGIGQPHIPGYIGQCWGLRNLTFCCLDPAPQSGMVMCVWGWREVAAEEDVEGALGLILGETLRFRDKVLADAQRLRLHAHRACIFHRQMLSC